jgi:hypothetical protein
VKLLVCLMPSTMSACLAAPAAAAQPPTTTADRPRHAKQMMRALLAVCLGISGGVLAGTPAFGMTAIRPAYFCLPTSAFPAPSTVIRSHAEPNRRIARDNVLHYGRSFAHEGRTTGYFLEAVEGKPSAPRSDTSYLVSVFPTDDQAAAAFDEQNYYWNAQAPHGGSTQVPLQIAYGDGDHEALYTVGLPTGVILTELLFVQGPMFVEVFQRVNAAHPTDGEVRAFFDVATRLDIISRGILAG